MEAPIERYIFSDTNPLGIDEELFNGQEILQTVVKVLEYKYIVDGLIEEIQGEIKSSGDIVLVVAWKMGNRYKELFDVTSYLDPDNSHHRRIHGTTHSFTHAMTGAPAFEAIILKDLISYLRDPDAEGTRQCQKYSADF